MMRAVCIESPLAGAYERNTDYARMCLTDSLRRGEAPFAGHLLYPQVLNDTVAEEREAGISAHLAWLRRCDLMAVYTDYGISPGMQRAIDLAKTLMIPIEHRGILR